MRVFPALLALLLALTANAARAQQAPPAPTPVQGQVAADPLPDPIRPSDILRVAVAGQGGEAFTGEYRVDADGFITLPGIQQTAVGGLGRARAAEMIARKLREAKFLKRPDVVVTILLRKAREVAVGGAVQSPGRIVLRDGDLLSDVLGRALVSPAADLTRVVLTRGEKKWIIDHKKYVAGQGDGPEVNPKMEDGDRVYVYAGEQPGGTVRVRGEVKDAAKTIIAITDGTTVGQVLQIAGGITEYADRDGIYIQRGGSRLPVAYDEIARGVPGRDLRLQDKDEIVLPRRERPRQFFVTGAVARAGFFPLNARVTLIEAIGQAGGLIDSARRDSIQIRRKQASGAVLTLKKNFSKDTDAAAEIEDGDVIEVGYSARRPTIDLPQAIGILSSVAFIFSQLRR